MPLPRTADVLSSWLVRPEPLWNCRSAAPKVDEPARDENAVDAGVSSDVVSVRSSPRVTVVRVFLLPAAALPMVNVVSVDLL